MRPKLKEDPREWRKFTLSATAAATLLTGLMLYQGKLSWPSAAAVFAVLMAVALAVAIRPGWFRGFYRAGMTVGFRVGQVVGRVLLTLFFLLVLTPMAWLLRLLGKDLLSLKWDKSATSYWRAAKPPGDLDRLF